MRNYLWMLVTFSEAAIRTLVGILCGLAIVLPSIPSGRLLRRRGEPPLLDSCALQECGRSKDQAARHVRAPRAAPKRMEKRRRRRGCPTADGQPIQTMADCSSCTSAPQISTKG